MIETTPLLGAVIGSPILMLHEVGDALHCKLLTIVWQICRQPLSSSEIKFSKEQYTR